MSKSSIGRIRLQVMCEEDSASLTEYLQNLLGEVSEAPAPIYPLFAVVLDSLT